MSIVIFLFALLVVVSARLTLNRYLAMKERDMLYSRYENIDLIFTEAKNLAYQKVFREYLFPYMSSGYRLSAEELDAIQQEYISCVIMYIGPNILSDLESIHGNTDAIYAGLANYLIIKTENEEVYILSKSYQDELGSE